MIKVHILVLLVLLIGCKKEQTIMKVNYYNRGEVQSPVLNESTQKDILILITDLISNSNDILKLLVSDATTDAIKQDETSIEIIFAEYKSFTSNELGTDKVKKLLFPLSGDFIGNINDPVITIFLGDEDYFTGPYRNENGLIKLMEIKKIIDQEII